MVGLSGLRPLVLQKPCQHVKTLHILLLYIELSIFLHTKKGHCPVLSARPGKIVRRHAKLAEVPAVIATITSSSRNHRKESLLSTGSCTRRSNRIVASTHGHRHFHPAGRTGSIAVRYLAGILRQQGFEPLFVESAPERGNVLARLPDGYEPPLMLLGHTDVVAAEPEHWTHPPFSGALADGCVWGRGALDMQNMVAANLMVLLLLQRDGVQLNRDIVFAATADEESGQTWQPRLEGVDHRQSTRTVGPVLDLH